MSGYAWGGSEELWSQAALRLHQEGHDISASVVWWPELSPKVAQLSEQGIAVVTQTRPHPRFPIMVWRKIQMRLGQTSKDFAWLQQQTPDLTIISQGGIADGFGWMDFCRNAGLPFVSIVQANWEGWWPTDNANGALAAAYHAAKKVFCVSRRNLELLECQIGESLSNAGVVWNPYNVAAGQPPPWPKEDGVWKLACVARLEPGAKGHDLLFQVLAKPKWRDRPVEVSLYGAGSGEQNLNKLASRLKLISVHFRGHVADVRKIWEENHLLVLPSRYEGLPLALVEAMLCARPAVVTDIGGNAEVCVDEETGFVAEAATVNHLDQALERCWNQRHNWQRMGLAARARAEMLIPKDPVMSFCQQLLECAERAKR